MKPKRALIALFLIVLYILLFGLLCILKYDSFSYNDFDLSVHTQTLYNILHGSIESSVLGLPFLGNHINLILFLIAPIYLLFQSALTPLLLQTLALGFSAYPIYLIAKEELPEKFSLWLLFAYLLYPCLGYVNLFEFHPTAFATLFISLMLYYMYKNKFGMYFLFVILTLLCQENMPLVIVPFGVYLLIIKRPFKWWFYTVIVGVAWFWAAVYVLIPHFGRGIIKFIAIYGYLGNSLMDVFKNILIHPMIILKIIFTKLNLIYLSQIFSPVLFLPFLSPLNFLSAAPTLLQHLLSMREKEHMIYFHYTAEMIPFIFFTSIFALKKVISFGGPRIRENFLVACMFIVTIGTNVILGPQTGIISYFRSFRMEELDHVKQALIKKIPPDAAVAATFEFLPKLSDRKYLYSFHHVTMGTYTLSDVPYKLPENTEYAAVDFWDWYTFRSSFYNAGSPARLRELFIDGDFNPVFMAQTAVLFKKGAGKGYYLYKIMPAGFEFNKGSPVDINGDLRLLGYKVDRTEAKNGIISFRFYWKCLKKTDKVYNAFLDILDKEGRLIKQDVRFICYRVYPTNEWKDNETIEEFYRLLIPAKLTGRQYEIRMGIFDPYAMKVAVIASKAKDTIDEQMRIKIKE